jgi:choline dehydrogenase-like flavoprotein
VLKFHFRWSDYERKQAHYMVDTFTELVEAMGGKAFRRDPSATGEIISIPGEIIHEVGTARMGDSPRNSVLNSFCQAHEVKNLFVNDGASFVSNPDKNPTLTISALAWRASDYLAEEMRKGNV